MTRGKEWEDKFEQARQEFGEELIHWLADNQPNPAVVVSVMANVLGIMICNAEREYPEIEGLDVDMVCDLILQSYHLAQTK